MTFVLSAWFAGGGRTGRTLRVQVRPAEEPARPAAEGPVASVSFESFFDAKQVEAVVRSPDTRVHPLFSSFPWPPQKRQFREFTLSGPAVAARVDLFADSQLVASLDLAWAATPPVT